MFLCLPISSYIAPLSSIVILFFKPQFLLFLVASLSATHILCYLATYVLIFCEILDFHGGDYQEYRLLECDVV
jgi:hypothetical protein